MTYFREELADPPFFAKRPLAYVYIRLYGWLRDVTTLRIKNFKKSDKIEINFYYAKSIHIFENATENWRILYLHNGELDSINKYYQILWRRKKARERDLRRCFSMYGWDENWIWQSVVKSERRSIRKFKCGRETNRKGSTPRMRAGVIWFLASPRNKQVLWIFR